MNTNAVADLLLTELSTKHARVYRNAPPSKPIKPYVVFDVESVMDTYPSHNYYVYIDIFDSPNVAVREISTIADSIEGLCRSVIDSEAINIQIEKINRQFVSSDDLTSSQMIALQFDCRVYFK